MIRSLSAMAALVVLSAVMLGGARAAEFELMEARAQLTPTGKLRVAFMLENQALVSGQSESGEVRGLAGDLARAIAERAGVPLQPRVYSTRGTFEVSLGRGEWDLEFNTRDPRYASYVDFSPSFVNVDQVYLVPPGKTLKEMTEVDRKGVRVAAIANSDAEGLLFGFIKEAQILRVSQDPEPTIRLLKTGAVEAFAGSAEYLSGIAAQLPGSRFLPGHFAAVPAAIGVARGRPAALAFVNQFLAEAKTSGLIQRAIEGAHLHGVSVAP